MSKVLMEATTGSYQPRETRSNLGHTDDYRMPVVCLCGGGLQPMFVAICWARSCRPFGMSPMSHQKGRVYSADPHHFYELRVH